MKTDGMNGMIRVVLVDPAEASRQDLQRLLGGIGSIWLAEVCPSYEAAERSIPETRPDLTLVTIDSDPDAAIALIQQLIRQQPDAVILPASSHRDAETILRLVRAGAREFLGLPAAVNELMSALDRLVKAHPASGQARRSSRVIAITGAAGGVGCTSLAVNLATILAKSSDQSVALADFDLLLGSVDTCLDIIADHTLLEVARDVDRVDLTLLKRSLTRHASGAYILPRPVAMEDVAKIDPEALRRVIGLLKAVFQTVIIDTSKGLQASDFVALEMADEILVVVQLDLNCLRNTARLLGLFKQFEGMMDRVKIVANRVGSCPGDVSPKKATEALTMPITWQIPNDFRSFSEARAQGVMIEDVARGSRAHRALLEIANAFASGPLQVQKSRGRFAALF
ncbi:MAG: AAA family ATPase [Isosphaeraceae bacterium]